MPSVTARLLGMLGARPFALAEDPLLRSTVDRVAAQLQIAPPKLQLIDDTFPRAFVVGRGPGGATLAVSSGLLTALPPPEVAAVVAHELAHVRTRDVLPQTYAVLLSTTLLEISRIGGFLARFLLAVLAPIGAAFTHLLLSVEARTAGRRHRGGPRRPARSRGRADPARSRRRARRVPRLACDGAALHREPVRRHRARDANVRHASAACRAGVAAPQSRRRACRRTVRLTVRGRRPASPAGRPTTAQQ